MKLILLLLSVYFCGVVKVPKNTSLTLKDFKLIREMSKCYERGERRHTLQIIGSMQLVIK